MCNSKRLCENEECKICFEKSFKSHEKSEFWSEKNGDVKPRQVFKGTRHKYWFDCNTCDHQFESGLSNITSLKPTWCPYCANQKLCEKEDCQSCFENSFASHEKSKYLSEKNCDVKLRQVFKQSNKKYWFDCECGHQFQSVLSNITSLQHSWCSYCSNKKLCEKKDCPSCFENSFASHEKAKYWSEKNGDVKSIQVFKSANIKYWFDCDTCGHQFDSALSNITSLKSSWCPYCSNKKLCEKEDCPSCFENSFASHEKAKYWSEKNGDVKPKQVFKSSINKYWFNCDCGHQFYSTLNHITSLNPSWCPYCSNPSKQLCENEECQTCFKKSFASHEKSKYLSEKNGDVKPKHVFKNSSNKYWFNSDCGHEFKSALCEVTGQHNCWCPICVNKSEKKLYEQLLQTYPNIVSQFRADWCKNIISKRNLPFDFVLEEQKVIIELDGNQHFVQVMNWKTPEQQFKNDQYKEKCANDNGYSVIRIIQEDVWNDTYDWLNELNKNICKITSENIIQNIYMCKNNEYNNFN
jgi:very-short-patch-repair endonuclease